jgi:uncharacterized membrane protein YqjE
MDTPAEATGRPPEGSIHGVAGTLIELVGTRFELLGVELRDESRQVASLVVRGVVAGILAGAALVMAGVVVVALFWDTHRLWAAGLVTLAYAAACAWMVIGIRNAVRDRPAPFDASVRELQSDLAALRRRSGGEAP